MRRLSARPIRFALTASCLFFLSACGDPQLSCPDLLKKITDLSFDVGAKDGELQFVTGMGGSGQDRCTKARAVLAQSDKLKKLVADNKDRCTSLLDLYASYIAEGSNPKDAPKYAEAFCK
jgi:hypothetical protein